MVGVCPCHLHIKHMMTLALLSKTACDVRPSVRPSVPSVDPCAPLALARASHNSKAARLPGESKSGNLSKAFGRADEPQKVETNSDSSASTGQTPELFGCHNTTNLIRCRPEDTAPAASPLNEPLLLQDRPVQTPLFERALTTFRPFQHKGLVHDRAPR